MIQIQGAGTTGPPYVHIDSLDSTVFPLPQGGGQQARGIITYTVPTSDFDHVELWVRVGYASTWEYVRIDTSGSIIYYFPEAYVDYELKLIAVDPDGNKADFDQSPSTVFYPLVNDDERPGFGGGRFGMQPFG